MSIYASTLSFPGEEHALGCAAFRQVAGEEGTVEGSGEPCDCGEVSAPLIYQGSHVLPSDEDPRGGDLDLAIVPDFITRDGRDDAQGEGLKDWLRFGLYESPATYGAPVPGAATVVLDRRHVEELRDYLTSWLEREPLGWS